MRKKRRDHGGIVSENPKSYCVIIAGEGAGSLTPDCEGYWTDIGIKRKLTEARCGGDRNARAIINVDIDITHARYGIDFEDGEFVNF